MKRIINIFLLCLLVATTAAAQSTQTRRFRAKLVPAKVLYMYVECYQPGELNNGYFSGDRYLTLQSDTVDIDLQLPAGAGISMNISALNYADSRNNYKLVGWTANGEPTTLYFDGYSSYKFVMPDQDVELVGTFEYDPGAPGENEQPTMGSWDPATGTLIIEGNSSRDPVNYTYNDREKVLRFIRVGKNWADGSYTFYASDYPNCTYVDLSRTNAARMSVEKLWDRDTTAVTDVILPATITRLERNAFAGTVLQTLVLYAVTPPQLGSSTYNSETQQYEWKTPFPNSPNMVVRVPEEAVALYQADEHWKNYTVQAITENYANLTVQLMATPNEAQLAQYKYMSLVLTNKANGQTRRYVVTGGNTYEFRYLTTNTTYSVELLNERNEQVGFIDNIYLGEDNKTVTFSRLRRLHTLTMTLLAPGEAFGQNLYDVTWLDSENYYVKKGQRLENRLDDEQLRCVISLSRELSMGYMQPDTVDITVGAEGQNDNLQYITQKLQNITATFNVVDSLTGRGIEDAVVQVCQLLSTGETGKISYLTTDGKGQATGEVLGANSRINITAPTYGTQEFYANLATDHNFTIDFSQANGTNITLSHTWQPAVAQGEAPAVETYYNDARSLNYELHVQMANGKDSIFTRYLSSFPSYTLYTYLPQGTRVRVVATDPRGIVENAEAEATVGENGAVTVTLPIVERGYVETVYQRSDTRKPAVIIFDAATGALVKKQPFGDYATTRVSHLMPGEYYVAAMSMGPQYQTVNALTQLQRYVNGQDYVMDTIRVANGYGTNVNFANVPLAMTQVETNLTERRAPWGSSSAITPATVGLTARVAFKGVKDHIFHENAEEDYPTNCQLEVYLPDGFHDPQVWRSERYYGLDNYASVNTDQYIAGNYHALRGTGITMVGADFQWDDKQNKLTVDWPHPEEDGKVNISLQTEKAGTYTPEIYLNYTLRGKQYTEVLETTPLTVTAASINVGDLVVEPTFYVSGTGKYTPSLREKAQRGASYRAPRKANDYDRMASGYSPFDDYNVIIMDGDQEIGRTRVKTDDTWGTAVTLQHPTTLSKHNIYAIVNGVKTEAREVTYDPQAVIPLSTKMTFFNHHPVHLVNTEVLFDYIGGKCSPTSYGFSNEEGYNTDFTFEINLSNNDTTKVYACAVFIYTNGPDAEERITMAHYNARKDRWIAYEKFNTRSLPYSVMVEPYYYSETIGSRERVDNYYDSYDKLGRKNESIQALCAQINELIARGNASDEKPLDELRALNRQLSQLMGVEPSGSTPTFTISELEAEIEQFIKESGLDELEKIVSKPFNELGALNENLKVEKADGLTAPELEATGYNRLRLDNGSIVHLLCDDQGNWTYVDLDKNLKMTMTGQSAARQLWTNRVGGPSMEQILNFDGEINKLRKSLNDVKNNFDNAAAAIDRKIAETKREIDRIDQIIQDQRTLWADAVYAELKKIAYSSTFDLLNTTKDVFVECAGKFTGVLTAIYSCIADLVEFSDHQKEMMSMTAPYCENPELQAEALALITEVATYSEEMLAQQQRYLKIDAAALALAAVDLAAVASGIGALPAVPVTIATIIGIGVSVEHSMLYAKEYAHKCDYFRNRRMQIANLCKKDEDCKKRGNCPKCVSEGTCPKWPKGPKEPKYPTSPGVLDPSGFVFEGIESNRLEGVTATVLFKETTKDIFGDDVEKVYVWDAENYDQVNPQQTDENGEYGWMVPAGLWQVKYEKQGYQTEFSEWLPVPPPQLDVNQAMTSQVPPVVSQVKATPQQVLVMFDKYMRADSLTGKTIFVTREGEQLSGTIEALLPANGDEAVRRIANKARFVPEVPLTAGQVLTLTVKGSVESYAGVPMAGDYQQQFSVTAVVEELRADSAVHVVYDQGYGITVQALPAAAAAGKKANVKVLSDIIASADKQELTFDAQGRAEVIVTGESHGTTAMVVAMQDDSDVQATVVVNVKDSTDFVCPMPEANYQPSQTYVYGTMIELTCELPEATIYYTLDGTCPCAAGSESVKKYEAPIQLTDNLLIKAYATAPGYQDSDIAELSFMVDAIETVHYDELRRPAATFTLSGVKLAEGQQLKKGIYIRGGRKIVVK